MRFAVTYKVDRIPLHYRMKVYSLIKEAIKNEDESYYKTLFIKNKNEIKPFSFATYLKDFKISSDCIQLKEITITVSSEMEFAVFAFNGLKQLKTYEIDGVTWEQKNIQILKEAIIRTNSVYMKTLSPILVEDRKGNPLSPVDEQYEKELNYFANLQIERAANRKLYQPLQFTPINMKKVVIKESNRFYKKERQNSSLFFTAYKGSFKLAGHPEDLQILYKLGIGKRTTYFGLLKYEGEEVH